MEAAATRSLRQPSSMDGIEHETCRDGRRMAKRRRLLACPPHSTFSGRMLRPLAPPRRLRAHARLLAPDQVDHENGVRSEDLPSNLRPATRSENAQNQKVHSNNTSGFPGVRLDERRGKCRAEIAVGGRDIHLGRFDTPEEAFAAVCAAKQIVHRFQPVQRGMTLPKLYAVDRMKAAQKIIRAARRFGDGARSKSTLGAPSSTPCDLYFAHLVRAGLLLIPRPASGQQRIDPPDTRSNHHDQDSHDRTPNHSGPQAAPGQPRRRSDQDRDAGGSEARPARGPHPDRRREGLYQRCHRSRSVFGAPRKRPVFEIISKTPSTCPRPSPSARPHICPQTRKPRPPPRMPRRTQNARHGPPLQRPGPISSEVAIEPTPIPMPSERMDGMSAKNAALYMAAGRGIMPTPPDFSKPSYASDRGRLLQLVRLAEEGDIDSLRAYAIKTYYSAAIELDRFRHRAILALEARRQTERAA